MDPTEEPLGVAEPNQTVSGSLNPVKAEIEAEMTEPPKAKHQTETVKDFCVSDAEKKATDLHRKGRKTEGRYIL